MNALDRLLGHRPGLLRPDYGGGGILGLMGTLLRFYGSRVPIAAPTCLDARYGVECAPRTVLIVFDGLGDEYLRTRGAGSRLLAGRVGALTSVFPSTTAAAITTFMTGLSPAEHGLNGWTCRGHGSVGLFEPLPLCYCESGQAVRNPLRLRRLFPYRTLYERLACPSIVIAPSYLVGSDYSTRHSRGAAVGGYDSLDELPELVEAALEHIPERGFVYAYVPHFDTAAHDEGMSSGALFEVFERIEGCFAMVEEGARAAGARLIATADHGLIDAPEEEMICLGSAEAVRDMLALPPWGERRAAFCAPRPGCTAAFVDALETYWPGRFDILTAEEVAASGLLGPGKPHRDLGQRVGELLLLPRGAATVVAAGAAAEVHPMRAVHGGLSRTEMEVPLIVGMA